MRTLHALCFTLTLAIASAQGARAEDIKVLTAGAMKSVVLEMVPGFEKATGHKVSVKNDTAGGLAKRIEGGEAFDLAVITPAVIDALIKSGKVQAGTRINLAKVGMGVAVKTGAPVPDIASVDAFKRALTSARAVTYIDPKAGGSSGIYFDRLLERLGIADPVRAKAKLKAGGYVAEALVTGEADLAVHQISEILPVKGVTLVGPLPAEVQNYTIYSGGLASAATAAAGARALLQLLAGPETLPVLKSKGMERG
ncbi:MAG TPA: substrate-binding domain-containing protein [Hyphomicrobiaceae bacterium]|nr:substrate-binding domain-containing protein [Hyphomicrobiaceae bacterium]